MRGLEKEYQGALKCEVLDATTSDNKTQIQSYGFGSHGMVIFDAQGEVQKKLDGHLMREPEIRQALQEVMESL